MDLDTILKTIQSAVTETPLIMEAAHLLRTGCRVCTIWGNIWFTNSALVIAALPAGTTLKQI